MSFKDYKKNSAGSLEAAIEQANKVNAKGKTYEADPDDWYPGVDKSGNGIAVIRFLPGVETEGVDFVRWWTHEFKNAATGLWYIENCLSTITPDFNDPVMKYNSILYNSNKDQKSLERIQASSQGRKQYYRTNIVVLSDSHLPENSGKIKKFRFGKTFFDVINKALNPIIVDGADAEDQAKAFNPFDLFTGANLRIAISHEKKDGREQRVYKLEWKPNGPLFPKESDMERVYNEIQTNPKWSLAQYIAEDKFKTFEELHNKLKVVVGFDPLAEGTSSIKKSVAPKSYETEVPVKAPSTTVDDTDYFANLKNKSKESESVEDDLPF